jgi:O6-methylguanine-DNA--protein-cysteine methyltransferase
MTGVWPFDGRVYDFTRTIPRGETLTVRIEEAVC